MHRSLALAFAASFALACSSSTTPITPAGDAGPGNEAGPANDGSSGGTTAKISGVTVGFGANAKPVAGSSVAAGTITTKSDSKGVWSLTLPKSQPFSLTFTTPNYATLTEQEFQLTGDFDRGNSSLIDQSTANLLLGTFNGYDATLGVLGLVAIANGTSCPADDKTTETVNGATFSVSGGSPGDAGGPKIVYFKGGFPTASATSTAAGQAPAAVAYNVPVGVNLTVTVTHPSCTQQAFPVTQGAITYTGNVQTIAGLGTSYIRTFLK